MKNYIQNIFICTILALVTNCAYIQSNKEDSRGALIFSILQNSQTNLTETLRSVVYIAKVDPATFQGKCVDSFYGAMTATNYYDLNYKALMDSVSTNRASAVAKAYATSSSCNHLGFSGLGAEQATDNSVKFKAYFCDASYSACSDNAIAGKINGSSIIGKGSDGVTRGLAFDCSSRPNGFCL
ncbi:MAG: hypothetical protein L6Q54_14530 [Leptospiraceae bacterium]|nr:hypothetical protein [Leptospiraceae bacterium]MCK6382449.1 hypothetical protein [Leptospiraceae bacterium]NUM42526.1 hypothetical protein [Leptospiraceae bacterium]